MKELAKQKESEVLEGELVVDHVHMLISIPPKYAVAQVIVLSKEECYSCGQNVWEAAEFCRQSFWAGGIVYRRQI